MLSSDIIKYLACLVVNVVAGYGVRLGSVNQVHVASIVISMLSAAVCFGLSSLATLTIPVLIAGAVITMIPRAWAGRVGAVTLMTHLMYSHYTRDDSVWVLDHSGALMMLTLRLMGLCFDWSDGVVDRVSGMELCGFAYWYPTFLTGPPLRYSDYIRWAHSEKPQPRLSIRPLVWLVVATAAHLGLRSPVPSPTIIGFSVFAISTRAKYYVGWILAEIAADIVGYKLVINDILAVETSTHVKDMLGGWNIGTAEWMRVYVYNRVPTANPTLRTLSTFVFSGVWHGFHFGNVLSFAAMGYLNILSREIYRVVRPAVNPVVYIVIVTLWTHAVADFIMVPFVILDMNTVYRVYREVYYHGYVLIMLGWLVVKATRATSKTAAAPRLCQSHSTSTPRP